MTESAPVDLPAVDDSPERELDAADVEVDDEEAERGLTMYRAVDDRDDLSNGLGAIQ